MPFAQPAAQRRDVGVGGEKRIRRIQPAGQHFAVGIDELNSWHIGHQLQQAFEPLVACTRRSKRLSHVEIDDAGTMLARPVGGTVGRAGVDVDDMA